MSNGSPTAPITTRIRSVVAYTLAPWDHALAFLRIVAPLQKAGIIPIHGNPRGEIDLDKVSESDLVLIQRDFPMHLQAYEQILAAARAQYKPVVIDLDDWLLELPENHPDRLSHHYAGRLFPILRAIIEADAVTVSTAQLAERLDALNKNIWVLPNFIDEEIWDLPSLPYPPSYQQPITLVYMGGDSHAPDFEPMVPVLVEILQAYGKQITFRSIGMQPIPALQELPNVEFIPFKFAYPEYARFVQQQHFDLAIAPLADNPFNRCKSAMNYLEYSALGIPGVYSRITPYSQLISQGVNGFLAGDSAEWRASIIQLIENPTLRQQIGRAAQDSVRRQWLLDNHAAQWIDAYERTAASAGSTPSHATLPVSLFASLTRQNYQWEQKLEAQLHDREQDMQTLKTKMVENEWASALASQGSVTRSGLLDKLSRGARWLSSQFGSKPPQ